MTPAYQNFLKAKIKMASFTGFDVPMEQVNPNLKPHTRDIVRWAVQGGNRAIFASFGLHKTATQLEIMRQIGIHRPGLRMLAMPLGVRQEFKKEIADRFTGEHAIDLRFIRSDSEIGDERTVYMTNYESIREGKIDISKFRATSLDEASVLRSYGSKTYQEFLPAFAPVEFKFVATATPSPNRYKELIHYAGYLGVMDTGQALTRFFQRDSEKAGNLTLYPHKEEEFWLWVASWAVFIQRPSDLGHSDEGYVLPELDVRYHEIQSDYATAGVEKNGQGLLIPDLAMGLSAAAGEKRNSLARRVEKLQEIVRAHRGTQKVHAGVLGQKPRGVAGEAACEEQGQLRSQQTGIQGTERGVESQKSAKGEGVGAKASRKEQGQNDRTKPTALCEEQDSCGIADAIQKTQELRTDARAVRSDVAGPGRPVCDMSDGQAILKAEGQFPDRSLPHDGEGSRTALHEMQFWSGDASGQPADAAGSRSLSEQIIVWCDLNDEQESIGRALSGDGLSVSSLTGSQTIEKREALYQQWRDGGTDVFLTKPILYGCGVNLQQCHTMAFAGIGFKFQDFIQAIHRIHRFGQTAPCTVHIIHTEAEREVLKSLQTKWAQHEETQKKMTEIIRKYGLNQLAMQEKLARSIGVERIAVDGNLFSVANNDCVEEAKLQPENSVDLIVTSIPFANHYEYSPSYNDFGHTQDNAHFWEQMDFLTPELLRILKPGRIYACHVKDRINFGNVTGAGVPTVSPFHAEALFHGMKHGFDYMGMITVVTDVVRENNQTYRLGYTEMCKDGTKMGVGSPEYVLLFHKPQTDRGRGYADKPVSKSKAEYSLARWQVDAHAFWRSSGNRLLSAEEMASYGPAKLAKMFTEYSMANVYDYEFHVKIGAELLERQALPSTFMSLAPGSNHPDVWHDINRMRTLNGDQGNRNVEKHICPLQFDIVDRLIERYSTKGERVYDPFCGLGTVPYRAILKGRTGGGSELNSAYFLDQVHYLKAAEREVSMPSLFDFEEEAA